MKEKIEAYTIGNEHQCLQLFARASRELATLQVNLGTRLQIIFMSQF